MNYLNVLVMIIVKIICYFLPMIVIMLTFWMKKGDPLGENVDEDDEIAFFKNLTFNNSVNKPNFIFVFLFYIQTI